MESNMKPTNSKNRDEIATTEDFPVEYCLKTIVRVAESIFLKNHEKLDEYSWKQAKIYVHGLCMRSDLIHVFYPMIESLIKDHVSTIAQNLEQEKMLDKYHDAWRDYKVASKEFQTFFLPFNYTILIKNREISGDPMEKRASYLKIEELTKSTWKNIILEQHGREITSLLWNAIEKEEIEVGVAKEVVQSFEQMDAVDLFEETIFKKLGEFYKSKTVELFQGLNVMSEFLEKVLERMKEEVVWCQQFLPERSIGKMRSIFIEKATMERMDEMIQACQQMVMENRDDDELKRKVYKILDLLPAEVQSQYCP